MIQSVAESLSSVVKQMARANANLNGIDHSSGELEKVAEMWKAAYRRDLHDPRQSQSPDNNHNVSDRTMDSSLSLLHDAS